MHGHTIADSFKVAYSETPSKKSIKSKRSGFDIPATSVHFKQRRSSAPDAASKEEKEEVEDPMGKIIFTDEVEAFDDAEGKHHINEFTLH